MATLEGTRRSSDFMVVGLVPDVCKSPTTPVPYPIVAYFDTAIEFSHNVRFLGKFAFHEKSRLMTVVGDEAGVGGGVASNVNKGFCRPIGGGMHSTTVRVNGQFVDYHAGTLMHMNCMGPEGPGNTIGIVIYTGAMIPGPVGPAGTIPASANSIVAAETPNEIGCMPDFEAMKSSIGGGLDDVVGLAQQAYGLATTDWSNPSAVLGAMGGLAGAAGMGGLANLASQAKTALSLYNTDWSDPASLVGTLGSMAGIPGAGAAASAIQSFAPPSGSNGSPAAASGGAVTPPCNQPAPLTPAQIEQMRNSNPVAYERYQALSPQEKAGAFAEKSGDDMMFYIPGEGFSSSPNEIKNGPLLFDVPDGVKEVFVAKNGSPSVGEFFGIREKQGNWYLFGGLVDLGSPQMPGAGTTSAWWVPDRILWAEMSPYFDYHDRYYYGSDVRLSDLGKILSHEANAFGAGATLDPLQLPLQALYSAATASVGVGTATFNSLKDFFSGVFGSGSTTPAAVAAAAGSGGCFPGSSPPSATVPPAPPAPGGGTTSTAGTNGILITVLGPSASGAAPSAQSGTTPATSSRSKAQSGQPSDKQAASNADAASEKNEIGAEKSPDNKEASKEQKNSFGGKQYSQDEVKEILKDIVDKNLAQSFFDHFGGGKYDFKINEPNATFDVFGTTMNSGEFGNFLAGFAGQVNGGDLGVAGVRIGGVVYDFTDTLTYNALTAMGYTPPLPPGTPPPTFDFDADSKPAIDAGVELGERLSPPPLYLPPGYMRHPLFPSTIVGPMGEEMTEEEARERFSA